jgi:hypothetical protein
VIFFLLSFLTLVHAQELTNPTPTPASVPTESSDYEVDYEEEPEEEPVVEEKPLKKSKGAVEKPMSKDTTSQGSRAEKKIAPMMKSETKSIYKKNGKPLDVDTD